MKQLADERGTPGAPRHVGDLLRGVLAEAGSKARRGAHARALEQVLGADRAAHCDVLGFRGGKLTVRVDSAPLFAELSGFLAEDLRQRMNDILEHDKIARIVFRPGGSANG